MAETTIKVQAQVEQAVAQFQTLAGKIDQIGERVKSAGQVVEVFKAAFVFDKIKGAVESVIEAYSESERAANSLTSALRQQGLPVDELRAKYEEIAAAIQRKTTFEDDGVIAGLASMQSMIGQREITEELTEAVIDFAAAKKMDSVQAFELVAKSIAGETNALGRYGIEIDSGASKSEKMAQVTEALTQKFHGQAAAQAEGLGSLRQLANAFGDFKEEIGKNVAPAVTALAKGMTELITAAKEHPTLAKLATVMGLVTAAFAGVVVAINMATGSLAAFWVMITAHPIGAIVTGILALVVGLVTAIVMNIDELKAYFGNFWDTLKDQAEGALMMLTGLATLNGDMIAEGAKQFSEAKEKNYKSYEERLAQIKAEHEAKKTATTASAAAQTKADEDVSKNKKKLIDDEAKALDKEQKEYSKAWYDSAEAQHKSTIDDINASMDARLEAFASLHRLRLAQIDEEDISDRTKAEKAAKENIEYAQSLADFKDKQLEKEAKREQEKRERDAKAAKEALELEASGGMTREQLDAAAGRGNIWRATGAYGAIGAGALAGGAQAGSMMEGAAASLAIGSIPVVGQVLAAADKLVGAVQALVDFIPNLLNKAGALAESITKFPDTLLAAAEGFISKFADNLKNSLPNLLNKLPQIIDTVISAFSDVFPTAIEESIPLIIDAFIGLMDKLPDLVVKFYTAYITIFPKLVVAMVAAIIPRLPAIASAFMKAIYVELPKAIWEAIGQALAEAAPAFGEAGQKIMGGLGFAIGASGEVLGKAGSDIWSGLTGKLIGEGGGLFGGLGAQIWNGLKAPADAANEWLMGIGNRIWTGIVGVLEERAATLLAWGSKVWGGFAGSIEERSLVMRDWGTKIWDGLKGKFNEMTGFFKDLGKKIADGFKGAIGGTGSGGGSGWIAEGAEGLGNAIERGGEVVTGLFAADGGIVPQYMANGGLVAFMPRGRDNVPIMAESGERMFSVADNKSLINAIAQGQDVRVVLEPRGSLQEIFEKLMVKASVLGTGRISLAVGSES